MTSTRFTLEVQPRIPPRLARLHELADDLLYSWERDVRSLFKRLDTELWHSCGHKPKVFLRRVSQQKLEEAVEDRVFVEEYNRVLSAYDTYHQGSIQSDVESILDQDRDLVAYFCAEFGFHESFPIYSGGLGILAADHCKAASDMGLPFVAVGMLYRQGYFHQTIDGFGNQVAHYPQTDFADLPISPALDHNGNELHVHVDLPKRRVEIKVWRAKAGHITLYLLDTDLPVNAEQDRRITYQLYGGDINTRIQQEIVLGIGGVRALRAAGLTPTIWHINEGHAAFQILERCRERVAEGLNFASALELVAAGTVFTTHTPVAAGHDIFEHGLIHEYFAGMLQELAIEKSDFMGLGAYPGNAQGFNMTALSLRGSRFHNGVSRIHGQVTSNMEGYIWPEIPAAENPIAHITNGVHLPTFMAREWINLFDMRFGSGWRNELLSDSFWQHIDEIPDYSFWSLRQTLKAELLSEAYRSAAQQHRRNGCSQSQIERLTQHLTPQETDILTIGFARRFATYKRATLLFSDPGRLARIVNDPNRPVMFIFAGKAHPHDLPGQHFIKVIHDYSRRPEFIGKIILLEGYDLSLARRLVTGVDVWLNTPEYPLEASGTSGEKAGINGVINLSVLDGWWGEGYNGENGWAITPHNPQTDSEFRNKEESNELLDILEKQVIPLYYQRDGRDYSEGWVKTAKNSMSSLIPRFNAQRMVMDYTQDFYGSAIKHRAALAQNGGTPSRELAHWKGRVRSAWPGVAITRLDHAPQQIKSGQALPLQIGANLNGLNPEDVIVECLIGTLSENGEFVLHESHHLKADNQAHQGKHHFSLDLQPSLPGLQYYKLRIYPYHPLLAHRFEMGYIRWV